MVDFKVVSIIDVRGSGATGVLSTGAKISIPEFVTEGSVIRVNTIDGTYHERVST